MNCLTAEAGDRKLFAAASGHFPAEYCQAVRVFRARAEYR